MDAVAHIARARQHDSSSLCATVALAARELCANGGGARRHAATPPHIGTVSNCASFDTRTHSGWDSFIAAGVFFRVHAHAAVSANTHARSHAPIANRDNICVIRKAHTQTPLLYTFVLGQRHCNPAQRAQTPSNGLE